MFPDVEDGARSDTARCVLYRSVKPAPLLGLREFWETLGKRRFPTVSISETVRETLDPSFGNAIYALGNVGPSVGNALHSISNTVSQSRGRSPDKWHLNTCMGVASRSGSPESFRSSRPFCCRAERYTKRNGQGVFYRRSKRVSYRKPKS